jgi:hypothetical protein
MAGKSSLPLVHEEKEEMGKICVANIFADSRTGLE